MLLALLSYSTLNGQGHIGIGNKLTFTVENSEENMALLFKVMAAFADSAETANTNMDSMQRVFTKMMQDKARQARKFPNEIYIKINKSGWMRQTFYANKYTDYIQYFNDNDSIEVYDQQHPELSPRKIALLRDTCDFTIETDKQNTKNIEGFNCYYVKVVERNNSETEELIGDGIYEMYVNEEIPLSMYALLINDCRISGFFPLEAKMYHSKTPDAYSIYKLSKVE